MSVTHVGPTRPSWLRLPRRTARLKLTALYSGLFLLSGAALVAITYGLFERATAYKAPSLPKVPHAPSIDSLQILPKGPAAAAAAFNETPQQLAQAGQGLANVQHELANGPQGNAIVELPSGLTHIRNQIAQAQHQLAAGQRQLAAAVHQLARVGPAQAAQRAADSHQLLVNSGIALAVVAVLALLAGWLIAGRMLRPIRTITRKARRISSSNLHERLALDGPQDELKELGDTLDELFGRLDAAFEAQRHFVANASHELRTPVTAERALLQVALDDPDTTSVAWRATAHEVLASTDEQAGLIDALLTLASSEGGTAGHERVDLAATVTPMVVGLEPDIERLAIHVDVTTAPAPLEGDPLLVERLVANLLVNAVRHNVAGGRIEVATEVIDGRAVLSVTNTGPVIAPADVERLFEPFERLDPGRAHHKEGHGLGLSIVRAIAMAHHASIAARPMSGGGLSVRVTFPRLSDLQPVAAEPPVTDRLGAEVEMATP